jgi:4-diphosphocytidyl-2-C-methyl-D-erythritol kinase
MRALAHAKVNLGLRVGRLRGDGFHPLRSIFQSISWSDRLELQAGEDDGIMGWRGEAVPDGDANLAWQAVMAVRRAVGSDVAVRLRLDKRIPVAAGLGGGSADAATALHLAGRVFHAGRADLASLAPALGSDVPFCLVGGTAVVTGRGEIVAPLPALVGYGLALVVPAIELATPEVYGTWDALGGPAGPEVGGSTLPPVLRDHTPLVNDLYPAAAAVAPQLDDWRAELEAAWGRPVLMTGSGPTLFGFFVDVEEAAAALGATPRGARATFAAEPLARGWEVEA